MTGRVNILGSWSVLACSCLASDSGSCAQEWFTWLHLYLPMTLTATSNRMWRTLKVRCQSIAEIEEPCTEDYRRAGDTQDGSVSSGGWAWTSWEDRDKLGEKLFLTQSLYQILKCRYCVLFY